jgi:hypothetical protein
MKNFKEAKVLLSSLLKTAPLATTPISNMQDTNTFLEGRILPFVADGGSVASKRRFSKDDIQSLYGVYILLKIV